MIERVGQCDLPTQTLAEYEDAQIRVSGDDVTPEDVKVIDPVEKALNVGAHTTGPTVPSMVKSIHSPTVRHEHINDVSVSPTMLPAAVAQQEHASDLPIR
jgi:D-aminopeptidase